MSGIQYNILGTRDQESCLWICGVWASEFRLQIQQYIFPLNFFCSLFQPQFMICTFNKQGKVIFSSLHHSNPATISFLPPPATISFLLLAPSSLLLFLKLAPKIPAVPFFSLVHSPASRLVSVMTSSSSSGPRFNLAQESFSLFVSSIMFALLNNLNIGLPSPLNWAHLKELGDVIRHLPYRQLNGMMEVIMSNSRTIREADSRRLRCLDIRSLLTVVSTDCIRILKQNQNLKLTDYRRG